MAGFYGFGGLLRLVSLIRCAQAPSQRMVAAPTLVVAAGLPGTVDSPLGHEWSGGAVGGSEGAGRDERWGPAQREPRNGTLLVLGVLSGSRNFEERDWLRRGFWRQRAWRQGVEWRFVVGRELPKGDNNRVSLLYEQAKWGDIDLVRGSEVPPAQALKALGWLLLQAERASMPGAPAFVALGSDALPRPCACTM